MTSEYRDVIVVGGGQAGLAVAYYLERLGLDYLILDKESSAGGSWQNYWDSLTVFSPAQWSSLPGVLMPGGVDHYPGKDEVVNYLKDYEIRYHLKVRRPVRVDKVMMSGDKFQIQSSEGLFESKVLISATGSFDKPVMPSILDQEKFEGTIIHARDYRSPDAYEGLSVGIVGEGNTGAQLIAEISQVAKTYWITKNSPDFLPDYVDGTYLFNAATQLYEAKRKGKRYIPPSLGDIVMLPSVKQAKQRGVLKHYPSIDKFQADGALLVNGEKILLDHVIFCTGYLPTIDYLRGLNLQIRHNKVDTHGTRSRELAGLWMVGYGSWTGFASATIIGVGRSAKVTAEEVNEFLKRE